MKLIRTDILFASSERTLRVLTMDDGQEYLWLTEVYNFIGYAGRFDRCTRFYKYARKNNIKIYKALMNGNANANVMRLADMVRVLRIFILNNNNGKDTLMAGRVRWAHVVLKRLKEYLAEKKGKLEPVQDTLPGMSEPVKSEPVKPVKHEEPKSKMSTETPKPQELAKWVAVFVETYKVTRYEAVSMLMRLLIGKEGI